MIKIKRKEKLLLSLESSTNVLSCKAPPEKQTERQKKKGWSDKKSTTELQRAARDTFIGLSDAAGRTNTE